jgi:hypothetical protein
MFILDTLKLLPGDVVLTSEMSVQSKMVMKVTNSSFSHALLYIGASVYIHADSFGVHSGNLQRLLFAKQSQVQIFRLRDRQEEKMAGICLFERTEIGKQYSVSEALRSKMKRNSSSEANSNRQFCSRLVAQAYAEAGINIVNNPDYCYPQDIINSLFMMKVRDCEQTLSDKEIEMVKSPGAIDIQTKVINNLLKNIRTLTNADIQTLGQLTRYLYQYPEYDHAISKILQSSGYLSLWQIDIKECPWNYDSIKFLARDGSRSSKFEYANLLKEGAMNLLEVFLFMHTQHTQLWQQKQLHYFVLTRALYKRLIELATIKIATAEYVLAHI